jgi:hypothetical protein
VNIIVKYHELGPDENRVVGFYVEPFSVQHQFMNGQSWSGSFDAIPPLATCDKVHAPTARAVERTTPHAHLSRSSFTPRAVFQLIRRQ